MPKVIFRIASLACTLLILSCAGSRFSIGSLPKQVECIAVMPFEIRYDLSSPKEMLSEFVALDLYKRGAHGVLGPLELIELFKKAGEPLPPALDPYWAREIGKKLSVDAVLFGSITQIPVYRGDEQRAHMNIDAYLLDVKSGAIRWSYGSKEEVGMEEYVGLVSNRAEEMAKILMSDTGDREAIGRRGCWTSPSKTKAVAAAPSRRAKPKVTQPEPLTPEEKAMLKELKQPDGVFLHASIFDGRSARLTKDAIPQLRSLGRVLNHKRAPKKITIGSHLDSSNDIGKDLALSKRRAEVVRSYLVKLGVKKRRVKVIGFGGSKPMVPNLNERSRAMNRRIEVVSGSVK